MSGRCVPLWGNSEKKAENSATCGREIVAWKIRTAPAVRGIRPFISSFGPSNPGDLKANGAKHHLNLGLFAPGRVKDDAAKVGPFEFRVEQGEHVVVHGSESGVRLVAEPIVEGVDDLLLEVIPARMCVDYRLPVRVGHVKVANPEDVHLYARCHQGYFRLLVLRDARRSVERDGVPHHINGWLVDAMLPQEVTRGVGTINFEALGGAAVFLGQADVVKHGPDVEQLGIELQFLPQPSQRAEIIDSGRMVE